MSHIKWGLAPGGSKELRAAGIHGVNPIREIDADPSHSAIIGMRADEPGEEVPGTRDGYVCRHCKANVRLAPSGQAVAAKGTPVVCLHCLPRLTGS